MSRYLILKRVHGPDNIVGATDAWVEVGTYEASSQEGAVRLAASDHKDGRIFLAVPERSVNLIELERETIERVKTTLLVEAKETT